MHSQYLELFMQKVTSIMFYTCLLICFSATAAAVELTGIIISDDGQPLPSVQLSLSGKSASTDANGKYIIKTEDAEFYRIQIDKKGYYSIIQTFSHVELTRQLPKSFHIAPIHLVTRKPGRVMFAFAGDVMMGRRFSQPKFGDPVLLHADTKLADAKALLMAMRPYLQLADFSSVNLETQLGDEQLKKGAKKAITFYSPPEILDALSWAGIDYVSLGNNHTFDFLDAGLTTTLAALQESSLGYSGAGSNETAALKPYQVKLAENEYALSAYVAWPGSATPNQVAQANKGGAALGTEQNIQSNIDKALKSKQIPIVQYHGSLEYSDQPTLSTEQGLKNAIDRGAALSVAHHPHVLQGFELYNGKLIAYSMGNFLFDQYFYTTSYSMLLYVWMDGDQLHRAEIVPVYLKGYQPTPATGMARFKVLKRLSELSSLRHTQLSHSGGHGIIDPADQDSAKSSSNTFVLTAKNETIKPIYTLPWYGSLQSIQTKPKSPYRLGHMLSNGGDFEAHEFYLSPERGWQATGNGYRIVESKSNKVIKLDMQNSNSSFGMKTFSRVFQPGALNSFTLDIKVPTEATINLYWQGRKKKQGLQNALDNGEKHLIESFNFKQDDWTTISANFNSPRVGYRGIRVFAEIIGSSKHVLIDNVHLIEWSSAYTQDILPPYMDSRSRQASFIGFPESYTGKIQFTLIN
jgi:poly-gamma-glutamate capsule biosynthesis protein CapA/YwtB (metallophosphatase superfamily)